MILLFFLPEGEAVAKLLIAIPVLLQFPESLLTIHNLFRPEGKAVAYGFNTGHMDLFPVTGIIGIIGKTNVWRFWVLTTSGKYSHGLCGDGQIVRGPNTSFLGEQKTSTFSEPFPGPLLGPMLTIFDLCLTILDLFCLVLGRCRPPGPYCLRLGRDRPPGPDRLRLGRDRPPGPYRLRLGRDRPPGSDCLVWGRGRPPGPPGRS